jgi:WD40 repeat protein
LKFWKILTADYLKQKQTAAAAALHQTSSKNQDEKDSNSNLLSSGPIEFVKHFRAHLRPIFSLCVNESGTLLCSTCADQTVKMFDVLSFDMITMVKLDFVRSFASPILVDLR